MTLHCQERRRGATMQELKLSASSKGTTCSTLINNCFEAKRRVLAACSVREMPKPTAARILFTDRDAKLCC
eukprot:8435503-Pyramimonas_sp.AAC.1